VAIVFGGGGSPAPSMELVVELAAIVAVTTWAWLAASDRNYAGPAIDWPLFTVAALVVVIPLLQLIPLPPAIWHHLPGRKIEVQALALVGRDSAWMPLSESPPRTMASVLSLLPPAAMGFMISRLRRRDRLKLIGCLAVLGLLAAIVGVFQLASGNANWARLYAITQYGFETGFQANRNADADLLLIAAMGLVAWAVSDNRLTQSRQMQVVIAAVYLFFALSVVLTGSRAGVALIVVAIIGSAAMILRVILVKNRRHVVAAVLGIAAAVASSAYFLSANARVQHTVDRFDQGDVVRPEIWKDTIYAIGLHWPVGTGIGTFQPIFTAAESLEFVRPDFSNRAHNDYLEFGLEAGIAAPVLLLAIIIFAAVRLWKMLASKDGGGQRVLGIFVLGSLLVLFLHSLVDYPERSMSLAVVTGLLWGLLGRLRSGEGWRQTAEGVVE